VTLGVLEARVALAKQVVSDVRVDPILEQIPRVLLAPDRARNRTWATIAAA
jgi:hypothetical protein